MEDERLVGYAEGDSNEWRLLIDDKPYSIDQPKLGNNFSLLLEGRESRSAQIAGARIPVTRVQSSTRLWS